MPHNLPLAPCLLAVVAAFEKSQGRILYRCANRLLGTLAGVAYSCLVIALCLAVTGGTYANTAGKYAVMAVLVSLYGGFVAANQSRFPSYGYAWTASRVVAAPAALWLVMGLAVHGPPALTAHSRGARLCMRGRLRRLPICNSHAPVQVQIVAVPVIVLESFREEVPPWSAAGWRIACVSIGVGLDVVVTSLLFPVTTGALMRQRLQRALGQLAALAAGVAACQAGGQGAGPEAAAGEPADGTAAAKLEAGQQLADADAAAAAAERRRLQDLARQVGQSAPKQRAGRRSDTPASLAAAV